MEPIEAHLVAIREDLAEIRSMLRELNGRVRTTETEVARLAEGQRRQDEEIKALRARDWVAGLLSASITSILAVLSAILRR